MRLQRTIAGLSGAAIVVASFAGVTTAAAAPDAGGRGPETDTASQGAPSFAELVRAARTGPAAKASDGAIDMPTSYPYQPELTVYPPEENDATRLNETIAYSDLAPRLTELMAASDRVSTQVVGQSTLGRDLYLVTLTAPEGRGETARQTKWRDEIRTDPVKAARNAELAAGYKTPIWISSNIHGNEWEGTDAAMQVIEDLATSQDAETLALLENHRLYFSLTLNPDGRTAATRATTLGLDANRDMVTGTTPEARSFVATTQALQPLYAADFHGYTNVLQVEPCGPPHGENYEYDLFIPHGYALALQVEADVVDAEIPGNRYFNPATGGTTTTNTGYIKIPYRDTPSGWDDYPPIFTAQYAAYHGAVTATVELPMGRTGATTTPQNARINTEVARVTIESMLRYVAANSDAMLADQIEAFGRGLAGAPKDALTTADVSAVPGPDEWKEHWDFVDDQDPVELPRAYVIPVGDAQRSGSDAEALVDALLFHGVQVGTLARTTTVGGVTYPAGSFVVDMHQPRRGLANVLLDLGTDISAKVPSMYDVSAWSLAYLWGATVDKVGSTTDPAIGTVVPLHRVPQDGVLPKRADHVTFDVAGVEDYRALNALLDAGAPVWLLDDGRAVVGPEGLAAAADVVVEHDIPFEAATAEDVAALDDATELEDVTVAYVGTQDDLLSLTELGFDDLVRVTAAGVQAGAATGTTGLEEADVLWVGSSFSLPAGSAGRAYVQEWVDAGGSIVGRTNQAFTVASTYGLVSGTVVAGNSSGNGIVDVDTPEGSIFTAYEQETSFVYPAYWFTNLGEGTTAEQLYDADEPFLAGHWRATGAGTNGPASAAGNAAVVSGEAESGARAVVFGTSPFYRTHTKGAMSQAAQAIFWAATGS
ncbi:M14 family zinc carboxypeptidase [Isoptericola variabilis]|uniref:Peptidase M14 carboxypeptidase A n=1 Tax=Isoptericola variabilis (strain 225) TaxID=743718 RepID=F6FTK7_ISOV2|nr:M14 family zinc carboxypeptidase [Isoptericola variabilis]AEG43200.1 peptidase M14 carboxypeptidase A [Isoptericola variabilis 225]